MRVTIPGANPIIPLELERSCYTYPMPQDANPVDDDIRESVEEDEREALLSHVQSHD